MRTIAALVVTVIGLGGCGQGAGSGGGDGGSGPAASRAPLVTPDAGDLVLTWVDEDGEFQVASRVADVPEDRRAKVRVQDPSHPPPAPGTVWIADLRKASGGAFPVRSAQRSEFEGLARPRDPSPAKAPPATGGSPPAGGDTNPASPPSATAERSHVVMYVTSTCPVCRRARRWLTRNGVSFVERDVGRDAEAARELREAAARQGVRADGVPVFDIRGTLIPGFDQERLRRELGL